MLLKFIRSNLTGWTLSLVSRTNHEFVPGWPYPARGIALLFYSPEKRLSVSIWNIRFSRNIRLFGPKKLSFEKD